MLLIATFLLSAARCALNLPLLLQHSIRYGTQELVFFREDLIRRMRRHCILPPVEDEEDEAGNDISTMVRGRELTSARPAGVPRAHQPSLLPAAPAGQDAY